MKKKILKLASVIGHGILDVAAFLGVLFAFAMNPLAGFALLILYLEHRGKRVSQQPSRRGQ